MALDGITSAAYHDGSKSVQSYSNTASLKVNEVSEPVKATEKKFEKEQEKSTKDTLANEQQIKSAISNANNKLRPHRTSIEFSYHEETKRVSIKVRDKETKELIREIPPEETLEMIEKIWELAGLLVDERR